jgi:alkyl hydroperoxide reductase subunit AhpC
MGNISLNDYKGKWIVLFSHPGDFTPVWAYNLGKIAYTLKTSFLGY